MQARIRPEMLDAVEICVFRPQVGVQSGADSFLSGQDAGSYPIGAIDIQTGTRDEGRLRCGEVDHQRRHFFVCSGSPQMDHGLGVSMSISLSQLGASSSPAIVSNTLLGRPRSVHREAASRITSKRSD